MSHSTILERYHQMFSMDKEFSQRANQFFPDGVTHDSRHTHPFPIYIDHAQGSKKWGVNGKEFIDYWSGHGALLLGHNPPRIVEAVTNQMQRGTHYGACHPLELEWADLIINLIPSAEKIRFTSSGTEATLMAVRLSRTFTGRNKVLKFAGHYHGWHDAIIPGANPPYDMLIPGVLSPETTLISPPNDIDVVENYLMNDSDIACVILEPTGASFGEIPTNGEFLTQLRNLTREYGVMLIFDEVITGFRVSPGGAQGYYDVDPDLTTLAKIMAGGLPGGAVAGKTEIVDLISIEKHPKSKKMPHPGTFNANPLSAAAGIQMLKIAKTGQPQTEANQVAKILRHGINQIFDQHGLDWACYGEFSGFKILLGHGDKTLPAVDFDAYQCHYRRLKGASNPDLVKTLRCGLLLNGIDMTSGGGMTTAVHTETDIQQTISAFDQTIQEMKLEDLIN
ncbi:MAG: aspartate aminotransferase family protein [Candidatus Poribacteria bacterium]